MDYNPHNRNGREKAGHSICDYLERRSTEPLSRFLQDGLFENLEERYSSIISAIEEMMAIRTSAEKSLDINIDSSPSKNNSQNF